MVESTIYLNRLYLFGKPMMLLHTLISFAINAVAVAILMRISALHVPYLDNVAPELKFDMSSTDVVSVVLNVLGPFFVDYYAVCAGTCN